MSVAIHYTSILPPTGRDKTVYGLQVAIADWMKAYMRFSSAEEFHFLISEKQELEELQVFATEAGLDLSRLKALDRRFPEQNLTKYTVLFRPEPDTRRLLWQRTRAGAFSFCGLAHAISGTEAGEVLQDYCLSPSEATDAIVCPSRAVQGAIGAFWDHYADYLKMRFGADYRCPVQLPIIPLGIDVRKFEAKVTEENRAEQREALGVGEDEIVLLWVGRLSAAIKAHPLAMFRAAEGAARKTGKRVRLVMVGYFVPQEAENAFKQLAANTCKTARVDFIAADDSRFPDGLWAAGDIFLSLIDNMQESFGLTPIEAMAAGLPRVISDWDGYRDSVTDGEDGFLIRTLQPPPGTGYELTAQVASGREIYGGFLAKAALTVYVDAEQAADRIALLIDNPEKRKSMAASARERVRNFYDWRTIIPAYEALWEDLSLRREAAKPEPRNWASALPELADPYSMYRGYPSAALTEDNRLSVIAAPDEIRALWANGLNSYAADVLAPPAELIALIGWLSEEKAASIATILAQFPSLDPARLWRSVSWLLKMGIVRLES